MGQIVYLLLYNDCVYGVYSTREKADLASETLGSGLVEIVEMTVD